jgi:prepilin-type N-terminal cleavage/methylation domain-containing protein
MVKHKRSQGFTLIELMLATSLLLMIMFSGYYAYGLYSNKWQKRTDYFWQNTQQALAFDSINKAIQSTYPYIVKSDNDEAAIYYQASEKHVLFVSHSALFSDRLAVVELAFEQKKGTYQLIYKEAPLNNQLLLAQEDIIQWKHQVVLLDNLIEAKFGYFGWKNLTEVMKNIQNDETATDASLSIIAPTWYSQHYMENRRILPIKIQISLQDKNQKRSEFAVMLPENIYQALVNYLREDN